MSQEKYQPNPEEIKMAEETMTDEQKLQSEARKEGYSVGMNDQWVHQNNMDSEELMLKLGIISDKEILDMDTEKFMDTAIRLLDSDRKRPYTAELLREFKTKNGTIYKIFRDRDDNKLYSSEY